MIELLRRDAKYIPLYIIMLRLSVMKLWRHLILKFHQTRLCVMSFSLVVLWNFIVCITRSQPYPVCTVVVWTSCVRYKMTDSLTIFLVTSVAIASVQGNFQSQLWVTKILADTLDDYVPDGGTMCRRNAVKYNEGLKNLKLWATQSKFQLLKLIYCTPELSTMVKLSCVMDHQWLLSNICEQCEQMDRNNNNYNRRHWIKTNNQRIIIFKR